MSSTELATTEYSNDLAAVMTDLAGQLAPRSVITYSNDARHFSGWLGERGLNIHAATRSDFIQYRQHLQESYAKATASRMLTVARRICDEALKRGDLDSNPAESVKGFKTGQEETPRRVLTLKELKALLAAIDKNTLMGKRDFALINLLARTGIRLAEVSALTLGDMKLEQGHHTLIIRHGKGDKRRVSKVPVDTMRAISDYLESTGRKKEPKEAPLFVAFTKGDKPTIRGLNHRAIQYIIERRGQAIGVDELTPHGLRASFVTLALEGGATLHQVQYAAGHADPRTTERYQKRKVNLDNNAVDFIRI